tara:strand:- start:14439 stop:15197 length:759 start_codon:yes stop_codon:yes gene_type:complete
MCSNNNPLLYEGKAKRVFRTESEEEVLIEYKDDATAFNAQKKSNFVGKGIINCNISSNVFKFLNHSNIPTHFIDSPKQGFMISKMVKIIPIEVVVRNIAYGSLCKQTPILNGSEISPPLIDLYYKDDGLGDPLLTKERLKLLKLLTDDELSLVEELSLRINILLKSFLREIDLILVDFKLEFGKLNDGTIVLADEVSPDTCRIWNSKETDPQNRILDKDRFRKDLGGLIEAYSEIDKRIHNFLEKKLKSSNS